MVPGISSSKRKHINAAGKLPYDGGWLLRSQAEMTDGAASKSESQNLQHKTKTERREGKKRNGGGAAGGAEERRVARRRRSCGGIKRKCFPLFVRSGLVVSVQGKQRCKQTRFVGMSEREKRRDDGSRVGGRHG